MERLGYERITPQVIWCEGNQTLYFNYDGLYSAADTYNGQTVTSVWSGTDVTETGTAAPGWSSVKANVIHVVFHPSFAEARPTSTCRWFNGFINLTSVAGIENLNLSEATTMSMMFNQCASLTSIDLSNSTTSNVTDMSNLFSLCTNLESINIQYLNTSSVTNMAEMFWWCSNLESIDLSNFNTANVTNMCRMFDGCSSLSTINLDHFNTEKVENMQGMFHDCQITTIDLTYMSIVKVTNMRSMFLDCDKLTTIYCDDNWGETSAQSAQMFTGCTSLVGGHGFAYDDNCTDATYANPGEQGYFTSVMRGDVNGDGSVNISDVSALIDLLLGGGTISNPAADCDQDGSVNISDVTALIDYLLSGTWN